MKSTFSFQNVLLFVLTITVIWLVSAQIADRNTSTAYIPFTDRGFKLIRTDFGAFPISIDDVKSIGEYEEIAFSVINPTNLHFNTAVLSVEIDSWEAGTAKVNLLPGVNRVKLNIPSAEAGQLMKTTLTLNKVYFK